MSMSNENQHTNEFTFIRRVVEVYKVFLPLRRQCRSVNRITMILTSDMASSGSEI